jgi:hypothetical protein
MRTIFALFAYTAFAQQEVHLPSPHELLSFLIPRSGNARPASADEENGRHSCSFESADCQIEAGTHNVLDTIITPASRVLEFGARFGTTTCFLAAKQNNSGMLVSVEPDSSVWPALERNRAGHNCASWVVHGIVSNGARLGVTPGPGGYSTRSHEMMPGEGEGVIGGHWTFRQIQQITGFAFNTLLIDCEGCMQFIFGKDASERSIGHTLKDVNTMVIEGDMPNGDGDCPRGLSDFTCVDYEHWLSVLSRVGFSLTSKVVEPKFPWIYYYVLARETPWARLI